jgi:hypothetical protein
MTYPAAAKPRNKQLSLYKYVVDNLADTYKVIVDGETNIFGGRVTPAELDTLSAWIELEIESYSGELDSRTPIIFRVCVRKSRDDADYMAKRSNAIIESILSLMNIIPENVINIYDFADPTDPVLIGDANYGFIVQHESGRDQFNTKDPNLSKYSIHYVLWLWTEGVSS